MLNVLISKLPTCADMTNFSSLSLSFDGTPLVDRFRANALVFRLNFG